MSDYEDFEIEILAWHIVGSTVEGMIELPYARLVAAMQLSCAGAMDCVGCTLSGFHVCIFEHGRQEPPAAVAAKVVA